MYCYQCDETFEALNPVTFSNRKKHLLTDHKSLENEPLRPCEMCGKTFDSKAKRDLHPCIKLKEAPINYTTYYLKPRDTLLNTGFRTSDLTDYQVVNICVEQTYCLPQYFPACALPLQWRQGEIYDHYNTYVNLNPSTFYEKVFHSNILSKTSP